MYIIPYQGKNVTLLKTRMSEHNVQLIRGETETHKTKVVKFSVTHLAHNPLHTLLPVPENEREKFYTLDLFYNLEFYTQDRLVLAFYEDELVGFCTGSVLKYKHYEEVSQNNESFPSGSQGDKDDITQLTITI